MKIEKDANKLSISGCIGFIFEKCITERRIVGNLNTGL